MVLDLLLETSKRRDYKLKIVWWCSPCIIVTKILLHRTKEEAANGDRNIKQFCPECRDISIPKKVCTMCSTIYSINDFICDTCEPRVKKITELELQIISIREAVERGYWVDDVSDPFTEIDRLQAIINDLKR